MIILEILVVVLGLCVFEVISSVDNAIINAHVLKMMPEKFRKIFLFRGIIFAVFLVVLNTLILLSFFIFFSIRELEIKKAC